MAVERKYPQGYYNMNMKPKRNMQSWKYHDEEVPDIEAEAAEIARGIISAIINERIKELRNSWYPYTPLFERSGRRTTIYAKAIANAMELQLLKFQDVNSQETKDGEKEL